MRLTRKCLIHWIRIALKGMSRLRNSWWDRSRQQPVIARIPILKELLDVDIHALWVNHDTPLAAIVIVVVADAPLQLLRVLF
jgi:hypothetical protein